MSTMAIRIYIRVRQLIACLVVICVLSPHYLAAAQREVRPYRATPSPMALRWADRELRRMTLDEKIGQLISIGVNATFQNQASPAFLELKRQVEANKIGGIVLFRGPVYESTWLVNRLQQLSVRPLLISADLEAGAGMRFDDTINFPWNMAVAATGQPIYARRLGEVTALEARALGVRHVFAPVADVNNNAANPVINVRSYGEDPADVARYAAAFIEGAQSRGVIATVKHFPGHGDTATDSHRGLPVINVNRARLDQLELVPFRAAIKAGVGSVMIGHIGLPQIEATTVKPLPREQVARSAYVEAGTEVENEQATLPSTLSPVMISQLLRRDLNFGGLIVTDAMDMSGLTLYFTQSEAAVRAVEAGADMLIKPADADAMVRGLRDAVIGGRLSMARVEQSARRILAAKYDLGLVQNRLASLDRIDRVVSDPAAVALAREVAERAITLVRDDANLLPLKHATTARIFNLAITNGDDRTTISEPFVSAMAQEKRPVETAVLDNRSTDEEVNAALKRAQSADVIVVSLYGRVRSGQARSVGVPDAGARAVERLLAMRKSIVGISFGNPYLLGSFPQLQTYLVAYGEMPSLQRAAARAVCGSIPISGNLPITLPAPRYPRGTGLQRSARISGL